MLWHLSSMQCRSLCPSWWSLQCLLCSREQMLQRFVLMRFWKQRFPFRIRKLRYIRQKVWKVRSNLTMYPLLTRKQVRMYWQTFPLKQRKVRRLQWSEVQEVVKVPWSIWSQDTMMWQRVLLKWMVWMSVTWLRKSFVISWDMCRRRVYFSQVPLIQTSAMVSRKSLMHR